MSVINILLRHLPSVGKYILVLLLALNAHSLPFIWHIRFWWRLGPRFLLVRTKGRQAYIDKCEKKIRKTGGIQTRFITNRRAWFDDCDYNLHLSNSCYAKSADHSMSGWMWDALPIFFEAGGYSALGGTHYTFIREIPIMSPYTIETRVVGWGDKWYYLVTEFIIYPKKSKSRSTSITTGRKSKTIQSQTPGFVTPAPPTEVDRQGDITPPEVSLPGTDQSLPSSTSPIRSSSPPTSPDLAGHAAASLRSPRARSDGGVVAGIAVHELCLKIGRMTVPPRIGFHLAGHSTSPLAIAHGSKLGSNKKRAAEWLAGGWKSDDNAHEIGRDIIPCSANLSVFSTLEGEEKDGKVGVGKDQIERAVKGMERVAVGLGETVSL